MVSFSLFVDTKGIFNSFGKKKKTWKSFRAIVRGK